MEISHCEQVENWKNIQVKYIIFGNKPQEKLHGKDQQTHQVAL